MDKEVPKKAFQFLLDVLFPPTCSICGKPNSQFLCDECKQAVNDACYPNNHFVSHFGDKIYCSVRYTKKVSKLVTSLKYRRDFPAAKSISCFLIPVLEQLSQECDIEEAILIPMPVSKQKALSRGYNQCQLIGEEVAKATGLPFIPDLLERQWRWKDKDQIGLSRDKREKNTSCSFVVQPKYQVKGTSFSPSTIILIDDICTTGKTMYEGKKAIINAYPSCKVIQIAFSHPEES